MAQASAPNIVELIGIIVLLLAFVVPFFRRWADRRFKTKNPEEYQRRKEEAERQARDVMKQLTIEVQYDREEDKPEEVEYPTPHRSQRPLSQVERRPFRPSVERYEEKEGVQARKMERPIDLRTGQNLLQPQRTHSEQSYHPIEVTTSPIAQLVAQPDALRQTLLLQEIFAPPLGLREQKSDDAR